jgi:hypothetical protein
LKGVICKHSKLCGNAGLFLMRQNLNRRKKRMAEKNENEVFDGENKTPDETPTPPTDTPGQEQGVNAPPLDNPAPDVAATPEADEKPLSATEDLLKSLNDKVNDFQKKQDAPEAEAEAPAKQRRGRQPVGFNPTVEHQTAKPQEPQTEKPDKSEKEPKAEKPEKPKRGGRPPKNPKDKAAANVGGGGIGGKSGQTQTNEDSPKIIYQSLPIRNSTAKASLSTTVNGSAAKKNRRPFKSG